MLKSGFDACFENIENINRKNERLQHCLKVHIAETARVCADGIGYEDLFSDIDGAVEKYNLVIDRLCKDSPISRAQIKLNFCASLAVAVKMPSNPKTLCRLISQGDEPNTQNPLISCMRGQMSDVAFDRFSESFGGARVVYADSFSALCENVYQSVTDYAIIPTENSNDGHLAGFMHLIDKYELNTVGCCEVENDADMSITTYSLIAKNPMISDGRGKIRVSVKMTCERGFEAFLAQIADFYSSILVLLHSFSQGDGRNKTLCTYEIPESDVPAVVLTLLLNFPGIEIKGIYRVI